MSEKKENKEFVNPIDPDKVASNPHSLEYGHNVGSAVVKPDDIGKVKGNSISAMEHQTDQQLGQIYEQMQLLADQAKKIQTRKEISERIYKANYRFEPIINHTYHLYEDENNQEILSIIGPDQWGRSRKNAFVFVATIKLLGDHTWEILKTAETNEDLE